MSWRPSPGIGRAATCRRCNGQTKAILSCSCLVFCGAELCTGTKSDDYVDPRPIVKGGQRKGDRPGGKLDGRTPPKQDRRAPKPSPADEKRPPKYEPPSGEK